jgi:hypothetical protein
LPDRSVSLVEALGRCQLKETAGRKSLNVD